MKNIVFLTFGTTDYYFHSLEKNKREAESFNIFNKILVYNETDLKNFPEFWDKHNNFILNNKRGYGYWLWKSYLTMKTLENMNDNDILVYVDSGCTLNVNGIERLQEYIDIVENSPLANISFELEAEHTEKRWTKMDIFDYLQITNTNNHYHSNQLIAGAFILRKCEHTRKIINEWYTITENYHLIDDSPSILPNDNSFSENRHDQSIFSLLRKKYGTISIIDETNQWRWDENEYIHFPIYKSQR